MADTQKSHCTGNCMACTIFQRQYCSSQIAYNNMGLLSDLLKDIADLKEKIEAIQNNEGTLINPIDED